MHRRFIEARVARFASVGVDGRPHVVPVCFAATPQQLITAVDHKPKTTSNLKRLDNVRANPTVSVLVDHYEEDWSLLWWVRVDGIARVVDDDAELLALLEPLVAKYPQHYGAERVTGPAIAVDLQHWTGWAASGSA